MQAAIDGWVLDGWRWDHGDLACPMCAGGTRRRYGPAEDTVLGLEIVTDDSFAEAPRTLHACLRCGLPIWIGRWLASSSGAAS